MKSGRVIISAPNQDFKLHKSESGREGKVRENSKNRVNMGIQKAMCEEADMGYTNTGAHQWGLLNEIHEMRWALTPDFVFSFFFLVYFLLCAQLQSKFPCKTSWSGKRQWWARLVMPVAAWTMSSSPSLQGQ